MKETKFYPELFFKVNYVILDNYIKFSAWKISGLDEKNIENFEIEQVICLKGYIKFDGCCELEYSDHYCSIKHAENFYCLLKEIYKFKESKL